MDTSKFYNVQFVNCEQIPERPPNRVKMLVTGGRDFANASFVNQVIDSVFSEYDYLRTGEAFIAHGGAWGADELARVYASMHMVPSGIFSADWGRYGRSAGPIRNAAMFDEVHPDIVVGFPGGRGTKNMLQYALKNNCPIRYYSNENDPSGWWSGIDGLDSLFTV